MDIKNHKPTLEQLQEFTELEINIAVTEKVNRESYKEWAVTADETAVFHCGINGDQHHSVDIIDYCNNWSDMGALANKHGISAIYSSITEEWSAFYVDYSGDNTVNSAECYHKNELRAKAIVFLMMEI